MCEFWYDYVKRFIVYIKTDDTHKDIAEDFEKRFDTSNHELDRSLAEKKKKEIGLMKDESGGKSWQNLLQ